MGNSESKTSSPTCNSRRVKKSKSAYFGLSEFSLSSFANNLSGRSFTSGVTQHSSCSTNRPWSRVSRHRWRQSTLSNPLEASKTAWPVSHIEAAFLPEFKIKVKNEYNFELIGTIGKGAYGRVYKVMKVDNNEFYAMKILSKAQIISENAVQQVKDEVRIQSMCGHNPFIVNCPYFWQTRKKLYLVSNYVSGGELLSLCQMYGALPEKLVAIYVAEIALALDFLHNSGVIYRDLKLENVLLDEHGHAQLIDFGLAKWLPYNSRTTTICGTLQYMAPEILSLEAGYGHTVDWWSLGVLACVLITSKFPPVVMRRMVEIGQAQIDMHLEEPGSPVHRNLDERDYENKNPNRLNLEPNSTAGSAGFVLQPRCITDGLNNICKSVCEKGTDENPYPITESQSKDDMNNALVMDSKSTTFEDSGNCVATEKALHDNRELPSDVSSNVRKAFTKEWYENDMFLPSDVEYSDGARDLIHRLLNPNPQQRLRSLMSLQNIRFFKDFNFADVRTKKVSPREVLFHHFPNGPISQEQIQDKPYTFEDFDSYLV